MSARQARSYVSLYKVLEPCAGGSPHPESEKRSAMAGSVSWFPQSGKLKFAVRLMFLWVLLLALPDGTGAQQNFPPPEFESGYNLPVATFQLFHAGAMPYLDVLLLVLALAAASWFLHKIRSRKGVLILGLVCLAYFGFYRKGCICPVGSVQNMFLGVLDSSFPVSIPVALVFLTPLVFALVFGRVFCGAVCPLGMVQDIVIFKPLRVPLWIEKPLSLLRFVYLGLALFLVLSSRRFIICEFDPFVGFFRMNGFAWKQILGGLLLLLGLFVARPYCRYLCPYGALLSLPSRASNVKVRITPDSCIRCGLCEPKCPFGAIRPPQEESVASTRIQRLSIVASIVVPVGLGGVGYYLLNRSVAGALLGLWVGFVVSVRLMELIYFGRRTTFDADPSSCLACARCFRWYPKDRAYREREGKSVQ